MTQSQRVWRLVAIHLCLAWITVVSSGCTGSTDAVQPLADMVFVCKESGEVFIGQPRPTPAPHPETGRETVMPGLYSPAKKTWIAGPPLETLQRAAGGPVGTKQQPLLRDGPIPETATPF